MVKGSLRDQLEYRSRPKEEKARETGKKTKKTCGGPSRLENLSQYGSVLSVGSWSYEGTWRYVQVLADQ